MDTVDAMMDSIVEEAATASAGPLKGRGFPVQALCPAVCQRAVTPGIAPVTLVRLHFRGGLMVG